MLLCYYLGAVLMLSDGNFANPITALQNFHVLGGYLYADYPKGRQTYYELNPDEVDLTVDEVLQRCGVRAHDPVQHP